MVPVVGGIRCLTLAVEIQSSGVGEAKERDGRRAAGRRAVRDLVGDTQGPAGQASELHDDVKKVADPQDRGRQYLQRSYLEKLAGTRMAGIVLTRQASAAKWAVATYQLSRTDDTGDHDGHRGHRGHGPHGPADAPDVPYAPYADQDHKNGNTVNSSIF